MSVSVCACLLRGLQCEPTFCFCPVVFIWHLLLSGGHIGKLRVYKSGRMVLDLGGVEFEVAPGTESSFAQASLLFLHTFKCKHSFTHTPSHTLTHSHLISLNLT